LAWDIRWMVSEWLYKRPQKGKMLLPFRRRNLRRIEIDEKLRPDTGKK